MFAMMAPIHALGGMEVHSLELAKGLAASGHDVTLITGRHPGGIREESVGGVRVRYADVAATSRRPMERRCLDAFRELQGRGGFDVVHSQSFSAYYYVRDGLKERYGIPLVTTMHGTARGEKRSILNQGLDAMTVPKYLFHTFNHHFRTVDLVRGSDAVIAVNRELAETIPGDFGVSPDRVRVVHNGVDTERFKPGTAPPAGRNVLSVSLLHRQKGLQHLIKAFALVAESFPDARLHIVGDGPYRGELEAQAKRLGGRVEFVGRVPNAELPGYYNGCDVFAIPSFGVEGLPMVELEAMSSGKPVVASDIGGIPSVISDGVNGLLFKPKDVDGLAERLVRVLSDRKLAASLGAAARKTIVDGFSVERMVADTSRVYGEVVG